MSLGLVSCLFHPNTVDQGLQSLSLVDCCVQRPTAGLSTQQSHLWNRHPSISGERGPSFASATHFLLFGAILSAIVIFIIMKIDLQIEKDKEDVLVHSNIAQCRGNTRDNTLVKGPRSLQRLSNLQGL